MANSFFYAQPSDAIFKEIARRKDLRSNNYFRSVLERNTFIQITYLGPDESLEGTVIFNQQGVLGKGRSFEDTYVRPSGKPKPTMTKLEISIGRLIVEFTSEWTKPLFPIPVASMSGRYIAPTER